MGVNVGDPVAVGVAVDVAVGVPHATPIDPINWNTLSGGAPVTQLDFKTQPLPPGHAKPPPGLRNAAPLLDCMVRSVHPHWPVGLKFKFACTDTQYAPAVRTQYDGRPIPNDPDADPVVMVALLYVHTAVVDGSPPASG